MKCKFYDVNADRCKLDKGSSEGRPCKDYDGCEVETRYLEQSPGLVRRILENKRQIRGRD